MSIVNNENKETTEKESVNDVNAENNTELNSTSTPLDQTIKEGEELKKKPTKKKKDSKKKDSNKSAFRDTEKGIQTIFRVSLRNHMNLSSIADTKANILLSVNAIILSLALSSLIPKLDNPSNDYLIIPTMIFLAFSITSIILSILATRPQVSKNNPSVEELKKNKTNLLFFGNFNHLDIAEYSNAMNDLMKDEKEIYETLIKDLYYLGKVLNKKYTLLRTTYTVFMIGLIVSVLSFVISFLIR